MFQLNRYFSIASFIGILLVMLVLSIYLRYLVSQTLIEHQTRSNVDLTISYANSIWPVFAEFVSRSENYSVEELKQRSELKELHKVTLRQMKGMNVVKVKIYNLKGMTVFSTDPVQIGKDKSKSTGFLTAIQGSVVSNIGFRNEFNALEQVIVDRDLVSSYIPIYNAEKKIEAVFEVYSDVTPMLKQMQQSQYTIIFIVMAVLGLLYLFLYAIVNRADKKLKQQDRERELIELDIRHQAYHDALTSLPNRNNFNERFPEYISRAMRMEKQGALMFIDLDRFKLINDSLGHDAGDQLLITAAERIRDSLRETDMAFRMSGDEFIVLLEGLEKEECAAIVAKRIIDVMMEPVIIDQHEIIINLSIGITTFPKGDIENRLLIKEADAAMYRAKESGHNHYVFFAEDMNDIAYERLSLETDLQRALSNDAYVLYYQPKLSAEDNTLCGFEALLRWKHPQKGMISPSIFIQLLEDMGLIIEVGEWVLKTACAQMKRWIDQGNKPVKMSVNVSAKQFHYIHYVETVENVLEQTGLPAKYLDLELTESILVRDVNNAIETMVRLKKLGVSLSLDDFGTGYSSLSYLKMYPIDYLKIDQSFVREIPDNKQDIAIVISIIALAKSLDMKIIAEGVETLEQAEFLKVRLVDELQGYYFYKPASAEQIEKTVLKKN